MDALKPNTVTCEKGKDGHCRSKGMIGNVIYTSEMVNVTRCRRCKFYEQDSWAKIPGFPEPIIVAHDICKKWSGGCKTNPDGYCFMGVPKDDGNG